MPNWLDTTTSYLNYAFTMWFAIEVRVAAAVQGGSGVVLDGSGGALLVGAFLFCSGMELNAVPALRR
jgi:uncharacterized membrane protein YkvI